MSAFKKLNKADVTAVRYTANKQWNLSYNITPNDSYVIVYQGKNERFNVTGSKTTNGLYQSSIYSSINHLFYQSYSGSLLNTGSLMFDLDTYQSASQQRPTASYFNYNTNPYLIKNLPSSSGATIQVLNINQDIFGSKVLPYSFQISSSTKQIIDDGYGNLFDVAGSGFYIDKDYFDDINYISGSYFVDNVELLTHVGNIFYAHGIVVITNPSYYRLLSCVNVYVLANASLPTTFYYTNCDGNFITNTIDPDSNDNLDVNLLYPITTNNTPQAITPQYFVDEYPVNISFKNEHIIYENEVRCIVNESDFNLSYNPTLTTNAKSGSLRDFATGSAFYPYATAIGLYNDDNELLMVAKLGKPMMISPNTDMTFVVKYDT
jgi:hypothetical protein